MGTPLASTTFHRKLPLLMATVLAVLFALMLAGTARAGGGCTISVDPETVAVGQQYVVSGNFGGAEVHLVRGENVNTPEDSEPVATTPQGDSFEVTITAGPGSEGIWTVWGFIEGSECGDSALVTVTAVPDTAMNGSGLPLAASVGALLLALALASLVPVRASTRQRG